jgi:hypothetical protein
MSGVIDTNILLYAINRDCPEHDPARVFLEGTRRGPGHYYLTDGIAYEFLRVATHPRVFPHPLRAADALHFIELLAGSPGILWLAVADGHWTTLRALLAQLHHPAGNLFHDLRTAVLMRANGIRRIYTADVDFLQIPGIEVVNPLREA